MTWRASLWSMSTPRSRCSASSSTAGFSEADARARISRQAGRDERLAKADFVIDNEGGLDALERQVERCWDWIGSLRRRGRA